MIKTKWLVNCVSVSSHSYTGPHSSKVSFCYTDVFCPSGKKVILWFRWHIKLIQLVQRVTQQILCFEVLRDTAKASVVKVTCGLTDGFEQLFLSPSSRLTITVLSSALINCCPHFQPPAGKVEPVGDWGGTGDWSGQQCHKPLARRQSLGNTTDFDSVVS